MRVYHMSQTLREGECLRPDYQRISQLAEPFVQALERSQDCFYTMDYGDDPEEGAKVGLFAVELEDPAPQYRDMGAFDLAYEAMFQRQDVDEVFRQARRYFSGGQTQAPTWEILSDKPARAVEKLRF